MKAKIYLLTALLLATMGVCGCGSDDEDKALVQSRWSGCKNESINDETRNSNQSPWGEESVEYESKNGGQLYLKHVNALFNCATENVEVTATVNGRCISIVERGIGNSANCICPMDVECLLRGLSAGINLLLLFVQELFAIKWLRSLSNLSYCHVKTALLDFVFDVATAFLAFVAQDF